MKFKIWSHDHDQWFTSVTDYVHLVKNHDGTASVVLDEGLGGGLEIVWEKKGRFVPSGYFEEP